MKYHLITYGCQMNTADSAEMAQPLKDRGMTATADPAQADIILMNTCTVREQAEHRAYSNLGRLREWKAENPNRILIVAGCAATRWGESVKERYPFIDLVSPATRIEQFPETVEQVLKERWNWDKETKDNFGGNVVRDNVISEASRTTYHIPRTTSSGELFGDDQTAYITVMRGCNYTCSYCIVPQVRGRESYRPLAQILSEVRRAIAAGQPDIMLVGQTVNSYYDRVGASERGSLGETATTISRGAPGPRSVGETFKGLFSEAPRLRRSEAATPVPMPRGSNASVRDFADLLRAIDAVEDVRSIRFMSPHPKHMRERVIEAMAECAKVARHLHLPIQSGSDRILAEMKRLYTRAEYQTIVRTLRARIPNLMLTTDIIVGYPGESDDDFQATLAMMREIRFDGIFAFKYSPRPGTTAATQPDDVPDALKEDRLQVVLALNRAVKAA